MNIVLWILQILLGIYFLFIGFLHLIVPRNLPPPILWMYDLPAWLLYVSGSTEILGGLGLILPGLTRIHTWLTPLAASGLVLVMLGAMIYHLTRGEYSFLLANLILTALLAFIAYGRWRIKPLPDLSS